MALERAIAGADAAELHRHTIRLATEALDLADQARLGPAERLRFLLARVRAHTALRELELAAADLVEADAIASASGDPVLRARVLVREGDFEQKRGDTRAAATLLHEAVEAFRAVGDVQGAAEALLAAGMSHIFLGEDVVAEAHFTEALEAFRSLGDRRGEGWALQNLAWVAFSTGRIAVADRRCDESVAIFTESATAAASRGRSGCRPTCGTTRAASRRPTSSAPGSSPTPRSGATRGRSG